MLEIGNPFTKNEILEAFDTVHLAVTKFFAELSLDEFFSHPPDIWCAAENLDHLNRSVYPVGRAMRLPKEALEKRFGISERKSKPYTEVMSAYQEKLANGLAAGGTFLPDNEIINVGNQETKDELLAEWEKHTANLVRVINEWDENELDAYRIPHPAEPDMTAREMLLFTLYHDQHHLNDVQAMLEMLQ